MDWKVWQVVDTNLEDRHFVRQEISMSAKDLRNAADASSLPTLTFWCLG